MYMPIYLLSHPCRMYESVYTASNTSTCGVIADRNLCTPLCMVRTQQHLLGLALQVGDDLLLPLALAAGVRRLCFLSILYV